MKRNIFRFLLPAALMMCCMTASAEIKSGSCGNNAKWSLDTETGLLSITGSGRMMDYGYPPAPWYDYRSIVKSASIGDQITSIGKYAFDCSNLTSVTIPNSVTEIGEGAFSGCFGLTSVKIPNSVTKIGTSAFYGCFGLKKPVYNNTIFAFMPTEYGGEYEIPQGILAITGSAFYGCSGLTSVKIPNSVTEIGNVAFYGCSGLTRVVIPASVTSIGNSAFSGCDNVKELIYVEGTKTVSRTFLKSIASVTIPESVTEISNVAFYGCSGLTSVYVEWKDADKIPSIDDRTFPFSICDLYVPYGTTSIYQGKSCWKTFRNIYDYEPEKVLLGDANDDGTVNVNDITTITAYILNGKATPWNERNADANQDGAINVNDITATAAIILGGGSPEEKSYLKCPDDHHPHVIDLGLPSGTKWCCCNVDAATPEAYGGYYAWGETSEKSDYGWDSYSHFDNNTGDFLDIGSDIAGTQYDVAHVKLGGTWRMPCSGQIEEILNNCTRTWTQQNGVNGILVTGENGGQIFLPIAGYRSNTLLFNSGERGQYWTSTIFQRNSYNVYYLGIDSDNCGQFIGRRLNGLSVRAVCP